MDSIFREPDRTEPEVSGQQIEVNVIILDANGNPVTPLSIDPTNQVKMNTSTIKESETERMWTVACDSKDDDVIIKIEDDFQTEESDNSGTIVKRTDTPLEYNMENIKPGIGEETMETSNPKSSKDNDKSSASCANEIRKNGGDTDLENSCGTLNKFLHDLYENKLALHNRFSEKEVNDIRAAVHEQVSLIAQRIYEIDSRLKVREVLPVGSSRENTQIIRPCEYDFIFLLDVLSRPGAVSIIPEDTEGASREYMHVKMETDEVKSVFNEFSDNGYILASKILPWKHRGLRDLFSKAVSQAVVLGSRSTVRMKTGVLKLKRSKPKLNGPATTIRLLWESKTTKNMDISVDLCSAIKVDFDEYYRLLPLSDEISKENGLESELRLLSADNSVAKNVDSPFEPSNASLNNVTRADDLLASASTGDSNYVVQAQSTKPELHVSPARKSISTDIHLDPDKIIDSVLLMPRDDLRFKVTFTEPELQLTANLSGHHKKCYKLLKFFINGEPFPFERGTCTCKLVNKYFDFLGYGRTHLHSYMIKRVVWDHQYNPKSQCDEENDIGKCVYQLLSKFCYLYNENVMHPLNRDKIICTSQHYDKTYQGMTCMDLNDLDKPGKMLEVLAKIKITHKDKYDYHALLNDLEGKDWISRVHAVAFLVVLLSMVLPIFALISTANLPGIYVRSMILVFLYMLFLVVYMMYAHGAVYSRWALLARRFLLCTKYIDFWLTSAVTAVFFVLILVDPNYYAIYVGFALIFVVASVLLLLWLKCYIAYIKGRKEKISSALWMMYGETFYGRHTAQNQLQ